MWPFDIKRKRREAVARAEEERQEGLRRLHQQAMDALASQGLSPTGRRRLEPFRPEMHSFPRTGRISSGVPPTAPRPPPTRHIRDDWSPARNAKASRDAAESEVYVPSPLLYDTPHIHQHYSAPTPTPSPCPSPSYDSGSSYSSSDSGSCGGGDSGGGGSD